MWDSVYPLSYDITVIIPSSVRHAPNQTWSSLTCLLYADATPTTCGSYLYHTTSQSSHQIKVDMHLIKPGRASLACCMLMPCPLPVGVTYLYHMTSQSSHQIQVDTHLIKPGRASLACSMLMPCFLTCLKKWHCPCTTVFALRLSCRVSPLFLHKLQQTQSVPLHPWMPSHPQVTGFAGNAR